MKLSSVALAIGLINASVLATPVGPSKSPAYSIPHSSNRGSSSGSTRGGSSSGTRGSSSSGTTRGGLNSDTARGGSTSGSARGGSSSDTTRGGSNIGTTRGGTSIGTTKSGSSSSRGKGKGNGQGMDDEGKVAKYYICTPTIHGTTRRKTLKVDASKAKSQAARAGVSPGRSGDPHRFHNSEGFKWGVYGCDDALELWEYPVFSVDAEQDAWEKDTKTNNQTYTAIRAVSVNANGGAKLCGVMVHKEIDVPKVGQGRNAPPFILCTPSY